MKKYSKFFLILAIVYAWVGLPLGIYVLLRHGTSLGLIVFGLFTVCGWIYEGISYQKSHGDALAIFKR